VTALAPRAPEERPAELNSRVLWCAATFVRDIHGEETLRRVAKRAGLTIAELDDPSQWLAYRQMGLFFEGVRELVDDDDAFKEACIHRLNEAYGPIRYLLMATSPAQVIRLAAKAMRTISLVSHASAHSEGANRVRFIYRSDIPEDETHLVCLSRQAQSGAIPELFGLPRAAVSHPKCIAQGDDACEYVYRFYTRSRWYPTALGLLFGLAGAWLANSFVDPALVVWLALPLFFAALATLFEVSRTYRHNLRHGEEVQSALREMAEAEADARSEIMEFHQRQKQWGKLMEEQVAERSKGAESVVAQIRALSQERATTMRGFSHDLRNPLVVLRANADFLRMIGGRGGDANAALDDIENAIAMMDQLLEGLVETAKQDTRFVRVTPGTLVVQPWVDKLRRRVRALVFGRDIRVSVFRTRDAPEQIETDNLIFERVVDNICTNAAKYTDRGSIVVEIDGTPGFLTIKISDTGRGIQNSRIQQIFEPDGSPESERAPHSLGVGLSVVVQLMAQIGGRLEVVSKPDVGTTFWAHFPEKIAAEEAPASIPPSREQAVSKVVTIRKVVEA
jgi:signal transduction histidine kinase